MLGLAAGVASWAFIRFLAWCEDIFPKLPGNAYTQNIIGMLAIGVLFYGFELTTGHPQTAGVGYATIQSILNGGIVGFGAAGGALRRQAGRHLDQPRFGRLGRRVLAVAVHRRHARRRLRRARRACSSPTEGFSVIEFAVVGMGAIVGGATGASMTAIVMIFEMTRDYNVIVPLVVAVALATGMRRALIVENIYTIKLRHRGQPIPTIRHTNMYLVRQARELMNKDFIVLPIETTITDALAAIAERPTGAHHRFGRSAHRRRGAARRRLLRAGPLCRPDAQVGHRGGLRHRAGDRDPQHDHRRMNRRSRGLAIVVNSRARIPRPEDVVGVIAASGDRRRGRSPTTTPEGG